MRIRSQVVLNFSVIIFGIFFFISCQQLPTEHAVTGSATNEASPLSKKSAGTTMHVSEGESIQDAIDMASPGDKIFIAHGTFSENLTIPVGKSGLTLQGAGASKTIIYSAGAEANPKQAPPTVPADVIIDILSPDVTIQNLSLVHPPAEPDKRDIGIFVRPPATGVTVNNVVVERQRTGDNLEPTRPGSRGILVFRATGTAIKNSTFLGNYEDHIHLPASETTVLNNRVENATRLGIVIIQESEHSLSVRNIIKSNTVIGSAGDGIQIQGDYNLVQANRLWDNGGYGIHLCGPDSDQPCVAPGTDAEAEANIVKANQFNGNVLGAADDGGVNNKVQ